MNFQFLKLDEGFHKLMTNEKVVAKQDFLTVFDGLAEKMPIATYALTGLRSDCDILLWRISDHPADFYDMTCRMLDAGFGRHLRPAYSYLGTVSESDYPFQNPPVPGKKSPMPIGNARMLFVAPAPGAKLDTAPSAAGRPHLLDGSGIDDHGQVFAFECNDPQAMRAYLAEKKIALPGPVFTCLHREIRDIVDSLGVG